MQSLRMVPRAAWLVLLHSVLFNLGMSFFDVLFSFYLVSMDFGIESAGLVSTTTRMAGLLFGIPAGYFIDRIGAQRALIIGVIGYAIGMMVLLMMPSLTLLIISQFAAGCLFAVGMSALMPLLTQATPPEHRTTVFGLNEASMSLGLVGSIVAGWFPSWLAPMVGSGDAQSAEAYRAALLIGCVVMIVAVIPVLGGIGRSRSRTESDTPAFVEDDTPLKPTRKIVGYAVASIFVGLGAGTFLPFQALYFRMEHGLSDQQIGYVVAGATVMMGIGAMLGGRLLGHRNLRMWAGTLRLITAPVFACLMLPVLPFAIFGAFGRAFFMGGSFTLNDVLVMQLVSAKQRGRLASLMTMFWSLGWAISSTASGYLQQSIGFAPLIGMSAVAYVLSGLSIWYFERD
jgi:MFS family permease